MKIVTSVAATRTDLPIDGIRGFPLTGLAGLYLFDGTDTTSSIKNWALAGGTTATAFGGDSLDAVSLLSGGGINVKATANIPGPTVDWTAPWSAVWQGQIGLPTNPGGAAPWTSMFIGCEQTTARGMVAYHQVGSAYPTSTTQISSVIRQSVNSTQGGLTSGLVTPGLVYTSIATFCLRFDGNLVADAIWMRGGAILSTATKSDVDKVGMVKNSGLVSQPMMKHTAGSASVSYTRGNLSLEGFTVYTEYISNTKLAIIDSAFSAIRGARGR